MKKLFVLGLIGSFALSLCGCSSADKDDKYDELERRVSALEERLAESSSVETQTAVTTEKSAVSESSSEDLENAVYDLSNMSASEIVDLVPYYIENRPKQDDTYDDVLARMKVQPLNYSYADSIFISYIPLGVAYSDVIGDKIINISYGNARPTMNGITVDVPDDSIGTSIIFCIQDYSRAEEIFDLLSEYFSNCSFINDVVIERDSGTAWYIKFIIKYENHESHGNVTMQKNGNQYLFWVEIP